MSVITADEIAIDLLARYDKLERQLQNAERVVDRRLGTMEGRAQAFAGRFTGLLGGVSAAALVSELAQMSDTAKQLDAQLRLATSGFGSYGQAQTDVRRLTAETRGELTATASLYGNFVRASQEAGRSQSEAARATETFAKALKIGGAGAAEAESATLQFGQALASGVLRGDEFNSIMEASPRIARLLADSLGVPIGQLRKMAEQGELTRDRLFRALTDQKFTSGIDAEFKTLPTTFSDAMTQIQNAAVLTFGAFDKGGQFSNALTSLLTEGTASFSGLEQAAEKYGSTNRAVIDGIVGTYETLRGEAQDTATATSSQFDALSTTLGGVFDPLGANATTVFSGVRKEADYTVATIANILSGIDQLRNLLPDLQRRAQRFDESTFGRRLGFTGEIGPRSELAGEFRQQVARSRIASAEARAKANAADVTNRATKAVPSTVSASPAAKKRRGKSDEEREAERVAKAYKDLIDGIEKDLRDGIANLASVPELESDRVARSRRNAQSILGREGQDYDNPFAGVEDYDRESRQIGEAMEEAERNAQDMRESNVRQLADLYGDLFTRGTDDVWRNFKEQGLRNIALVLAQASIASFGKGGGGFGSLLGNIASAASSALGGSSTALLPRLANGGSIAAGGMGGVDRNVLSVNGVPRAMISANERLSVVNPAALAMPGNATARSRPASTTVMQTIQVDARGAVMNDQFAKLILARAGQDARIIAGGAYKAAVRDGPIRAARENLLKG